MDDRSVRDALWGEQRADIEAALTNLDPDLAALIFDVAYDRVLARPGLELRTRELLAVTALLSVGSERELQTHMRGALRCGASVDELRETVLQAAVFLGFPKALMGMRVLQNVRAALERPAHVEAEELSDNDAEHDPNREQQRQ